MESEASCFSLPTTLLELSAQLDGVLLLLLSLCSLVFCLHVCMRVLDLGSYTCELPYVGAGN